MLQQIIGAVGDAIGAVIAFIPLALAFLAILIIGYFVAKALQKLTDAVLERVGFDRLVERGGVKQVLSRSKYDASSLLASAVYWVVMLFVLQLAFGIFGPNPVSTLINDLIGYLPNVFAAALIVVIGAAIAAAVRELVLAATGTLTYGRILANVTAGAVLVVAGFAAVTQLGIAPLIVAGLFYAILAAFVGILIVAIGGAGIEPLRGYWSRALNRVEMEAPKIREGSRGTGERVKERAEEGRREVPVERGAEAPQGGRQPVGRKGPQG
ncbi:MAG: hypothetical protein IBX62_05110 [Coriobacteriia bacterium]|nr:hypothetical protein [Coriobacteriia bacterium]